MRLIHQTWMSMIMALAMLGGCASRGNVEILESALRVQEDQLAELQRQLAAVNGELDISRNEITQLRQQLAAAGQQTHAPEHLENEFKAVGLRFNSYLTSGIDRDGLPGDEKLSVLMYPHDDQGGLVKLPGTIELRAIDLAAPEGQQEVGRWSFDAAQTKAAWHSGFLAAGFLFEEAWHQMPKGNDITLHARFTTIDGRQFDAVQPLKVQAASPGDEPQLAPPLARVKRTPSQSGKPVIQQSGFDSEADLNAVSTDDDEDPPIDSGVIETSDRYREWEVPTIR